MLIKLKSEEDDRDTLCPKTMPTLFGHILISGWGNTTDIAREKEIDMKGLARNF